MRKGDFSANRSLLNLSAIAFVIGVIATGTAWVLIQLISFFTNLFFFGRFSIQTANPAQNHLGLWVILIPAVGGLIIGLMARYGSERIRGHGIPEALEAILYSKSVMQPKVAVLKPISSAVSIGSGGPFGAEGPIIMTGGAVGSLIAQAFHLTSAERKILLVSGAAAGMSAVFASPIAAACLAVELLLFEFRPRSLIPVAIASIVASVLRPYFLGEGPVFPLETHLGFTFWGFLACAFVGVAAGIFSAATSKLLYRVEDFFHHLPFHWMWWCPLGGLVVGIGGFFQPRALGVGYDVIGDLLHGGFTAKGALALLGVKSLIWVVSLASGTSGGVLAPLLMMGCGLGVVEMGFLPHSLSALYPLVSMAAVMGGMMRAPFTAVMFALELTHDVSSLVPTLTATIFAYAVTVLILKRSILTEKLARRGFDIFREYSVDPLEMTRVSDVMSSNVVTVSDSVLISQVFDTLFSGKQQKSRGYPVVNAQGLLCGMLTSADIRGDGKVADVISGRIITIFPGESCRIAAEKMATYGVGRLPVVSEEDPLRVIGIITRSDILKPRLEHHEHEQKRERLLWPTGI